jgi:hypothetical protein
MRHRVLIVLLAFGTVAGYASGFASLSRRAHCHGGWSQRWSQARETPPPACAPCPGAVAPPPAAPR